jgi:hypothetical protein
MMPGIVTGGSFESSAAECRLDERHPEGVEP